MVYEAIKGLVQYGLDTGLISEVDAVYARNQILDVMKMDEYQEPTEDAAAGSLEDILKALMDHAHETGALEDDSIVYRDLFDTKLMNCLMPRPSEVVREFWDHYKVSPEEATNWYYKLSQDSDYIRRYRIVKDMKWTTKTRYGTLDITVNLSKPEKDPKAIAEMCIRDRGKDIGTILKMVGMTLVSTVGGASGPLYGTAYMKAGMVLAGKNEMDITDFLAMMKAAVEGVMQRGHATVEEATMLDAMVPSLTAMETAAGEGKSTVEVLGEGVRAAWAGAEHTKDLVATKGRASYVGERGLGHQDPGATSYSYMLETIARLVG